MSATRSARASRKSWATRRGFITTRRRIYAGYAGWGAGQLEDELGRDDWILERALNDDVFTEDPEELWREVLRRKGGVFELVSRMPEDPSVN